MLSTVNPGMAAVRFFKLSTVGIFTLDDGTGATDILAAWYFSRSVGNSVKDDFYQRKIH